nr:Non-LTR retroelement reverse transcriptase-like, putative [Ipomoea batatas]
MQGNYTRRNKHDNSFESLMRMITEVERSRISHIYREQNSVADGLAKLALTGDSEWIEFDQPPLGCRNRVSNYLLGVSPEMFNMLFKMSPSPRTLSMKKTDYVAGQVAASHIPRHTSGPVGLAGATSGDAGVSIAGNMVMQEYVHPGPRDDIEVGRSSGELLPRQHSHLVQSLSDPPVGSTRPAYCDSESCSLDF